MTVSTSTKIWTFDGKLPLWPEPRVTSALVAPGLLAGSIAAGMAVMSLGFLMGLQGIWARATEAPGKPVETHPVAIAEQPASSQPIQFLAPVAEDLVEPVSKPVIIDVEAIATPLKVRPMGLLEPRAPGGDDLRKISGIGPKLAMVLNDLGVWHFDQIASWGPAEIAWVDDHLKFPGRVLRDQWIDQAKALKA